MPKNRDEDRVERDVNREIERKLRSQREAQQPPERRPLPISKDPNAPPEDVRRNPGNMQRPRG